MVQKRLLKKLLFLIFVIGIGFLGFLLLRETKEVEIYPKNEEEDLFFKPNLLDWEEITSDASWSARDSHAVVVFQNKIWLMGGLNGNGFQDEKGNVPYWVVPHYRDIWSSEDGKNWQLVIKSAPWGKRRSMRVAVFKDELWLVGGWGPDIGYSNKIWVSENGKKWKEIKPRGNLPAIEGHQLVVFDNKLWIIGGVRYDEREEKNYVWSSEDGINWVEVASSNPWAPRWDHAVAVFKNKLWLIGGMDLQGNTYKDIWVSENGKDWSLVTDTPPWQERQGHNLAVFHNRIWIIGRLNSPDEGGGDNDVWYSEDGLNWERTEKNPLWLGREDSEVVIFNDKIWQIGGMDANCTWQNDVWSSIVSY